MATVRPALWCLAGVLVVIVGTSERASAQVERGRVAASEGVADRHDVAFPSGFMADANSGTWRTEIARPGAHFIRFRFVDIRDSGADDYEVIVFNGELTRVASYTRAEFRVRRTFWSPYVPGGVARVAVVPKMARLPAALRFRIGEYVYGAPGAVLESVRDENDPKLRPLSAYASDAALQTVARAVVKLRGVGRNAAGTCTGFMVGPDLLLTNEHCVPSPAICESMLGYFDWDPAIPDAADKRFRCTKLERVSATLDYALVRLNGDPGRKERWGYLTLLAAPPSAPPRTKGDVLYVVQYPGIVDDKQVAREGCALTTVDAPGVDPAVGTDFGHSCDTKTGSSGAPVLDVHHRVVGLHHWAFDLMDPAWNDQNRAVQMERVFTAIRPFLK